MQILDNIIILALIAGAFVAGLKIANHYHEQEKLSHVILPEPHVYKPLSNWEDLNPENMPDLKSDDNDGDNIVDGEFIDRLKSNGFATKKVR